MFRDKLNKIIGSKDSKPDGKDGRKIENLVVFAIIFNNNNYSNKCNMERR